MAKTQKTEFAKRRFSDSKPSRSSSSAKPRWHALGLGQEAPHRDPAALTFARLGLLATRW